mmetsp:Transcript_7994/g.18031  ORF Transcript_7994/g.18031 Transcript_7994/m.18031 type:complete len:100 (-) Transcript_7994:225-524(-)
MAQQYHRRKNNRNAPTRLQRHTTSLHQYNNSITNIHLNFDLQTPAPFETSFVSSQRWYNDISDARTITIITTNIWPWHLHSVNATKSEPKPHEQHNNQH